MVRVLIHEWVTGGGLAGRPLPGSWATEGAAMRRALAREFASLPGVRVTVTLDDRVSADDGPWEIVRIGAGEELPLFEALAGRADYTLAIAPETGGILAERARAIRRAGGQSLGSTAEAVTLAADKLIFERHLVRQGIATPPCRVVQPADRLPEDHLYPAILKPRDGAGSLDTFLIPNAGLVPEAARAMETAVLQPYVPGIPLSASFLAGPSASAQLIGVGRQRIAINGARVSYHGGELPAPRDWLTPDVTRAVRAVEGLRGFVGVDFVYDEANCRATVIELNPRPTTSVVGLLSLLPPGRLARAWLGGADDLASLVHSQAPVTFDPDGTFRNEKGVRHV
ncbi:MAG: ATP-grasp domain-containing protein [Isosphaeraceae bacterium]|nr:ATP-grasp domain-containing protein [Isosphaeraceae bacterium]